MYGGDGFWMFADPSDPRLHLRRVAGRHIGRVNRITHEYRDIQPQADYKEKLRWNWNTPIALSPERQGHPLHRLAVPVPHARPRPDLGSHLARPDHQRSAEAAAGAVRRHHRRQFRGGNAHDDLLRSANRRRTANVIWVGTDDGNVQVTRDGGKSLEERHRNVRASPPNSWVSYIDASRFDAGTAYVAFDRHTFGDMAPMSYKTTDYGSHWQALACAADQGHPRLRARAARGSGASADLLFAGTEFGLWISPDDGATLGAVQGRRFPGRRGARPRGAAARRRPRAGHAWPRHLDHRRPHAAAFADAGDPAAGSGFLPDASAAAAHQHLRRLAGRRRQLRRHQRIRRRHRHLLPEGPAPVRATEAGSPRRAGQGRRHAAGRQASRHQSRQLADERQAAAGATGGVDRR